jgi:hypothetical protein
VCLVSHLPQEDGMLVYCCALPCLLLPLGASWWVVGSISQSDWSKYAVSSVSSFFDLPFSWRLTPMRLLV